MTHDVVIVGGGPCGLAAALTLGRARKRVLLCDSGPRRNATAVRMHNFPTRDGTPPEEFRRIGREQLAAYGNVEVRDTAVEAIGGERGAFELRLATGSVVARRILLCTGMIDELPEIDGFRALWGRSIFICPYCHAWEVQDRRFGYLAMGADGAQFALFLRGWTRDVTLCTDGKFVVTEALRSQLTDGGVAVEEQPIARLTAGNHGLQGIEFEGGRTVPLDVLFAHPSQTHVPLVRSLGLALNETGYVVVDDMRHETSVPGIFAAGDLIVQAQSALGAASSGMHAAAIINHELTAELAASGALR